MDIDAVWDWLSVILPTLAIAFCIWLVVRILNRRERWAKRLALGLACLPFVYVLSFGPACWLIAYVGVAPAQPHPPMRAADWIGLVYVPCGQMALHAPACVVQPLAWYAGVGIPKGKPVLIPLRLRYWLHGDDSDDGE